MLNPEIAFLNFGSFGATPRPIFEDYQRWQQELAFDPVRFMQVSGPLYLQRSREALAKYVNCNPDDLVYVTNPSYAVNIVAKSLKLSAGDEILSTDLEYGALDRTWNYYCRKAGANYVRQPVSLPFTSKDKFIEDFFKGCTARTKAVFISQITSTTALRFPVKEICEIAKQKGLFTIVDGAHVPGHVPLDLADIKADVYAGACHKWMMTPPGSSFLYVKREYQELFDPLVVSWGYESMTPSHSRFLDYHQMQGTRDFSAFLTIPAAIEFMNRNNWWQVAAECRKMAHQNYPRFCELLETNALCPVNDEFLGQMCSTPINTPEPVKLQQLLYEVYKIQIPLMWQDGKIFIRYSINAFNTQSDLDRLYDALKEIKSKKELIK